MNRFFAFSAFFVLFSSMGFAQNSNNETRIIGSWNQVPYVREGYSSDYLEIVSWVFNANGTVTKNTRSFNLDRESESSSSDVFRFIATDSKLLLFKTENLERDSPAYKFVRGNSIMVDEELYNYSISANGKTLILEIFEFSSYSQGFRVCLLTKE